MYVCRHSNEIIEVKTNVLITAYIDVMLVNVANSIEHCDILLHARMYKTNTSIF